jgi:hypothetical protein
MREIIFMKCNCVADATCNGKPSCATHSCQEQVPAPNLKGRKAICSYGHNVVDSDGALAFFRYKPDKEYDDYYCGCYGWD